LAHPQKPRGRAVIIANSDFGASTLSRRKGTEVDIRELKRVFIWLKFKVIVHENLTSEVSFTHLSRITELITSFYSGMLLTLYMMSHDCFS